VVTGTTLLQKKEIYADRITDVQVSERQYDY